MPLKRHDDEQGEATVVAETEAHTALDLRPFARLAAIGDSVEMRQLIFELVASEGPNAQVIAETVAVRGLLDESELLSVHRFDTPDEVVARLRPRTTSLLVLLAPGGHALTDNGLREHKSLAKIVIRTLTLGPRHGVEAILSLDGKGGRSLFVASEFIAELRRQGHESSAAVLFDQAAATLEHERNPALTEPVAVTEVEIAILGPLALTGNDYPLERHPKLAELVVYLALHPEGTTSRNWTTALWPERRVPNQTVANRLSEARRILGFASDERPRLRRNGERYLLAECHTDWQRFQELAASDDPPDWCAALSLVRGRPFDELSQGQWAVFEGHLGEIERAITTLALELASHAMRMHDPATAAWAAQQALRACPYDERLHRVLMRTADALGNRAGVESTLRQLAMILEIEGNPLAGVHPDTAALYETLTQKS